MARAQAQPVPPHSKVPRLSDVLHRKLIFVSGKGGVGKTVVAEAAARALASAGKRVLWVSFEDPGLKPGELRSIDRNLWHLNCEASHAFEEYVSLKIPVSRFAKIFVENKLMRYLAKAAPGIHELVLLGKVWFERENYDHVIVDMLSTGYGVAMFQATTNFSQLFQGGPIQKDALEMLETFADPKVTGQLIVGLPEEMPLREGLELHDLLLSLFPENSPGFVVNRCFPSQGDTAIGATKSGSGASSSDWSHPLAKTEREYVEKRRTLEAENLGIWESLEIPFEKLSYIVPPEDIVPKLTQEIGALL